MLTDTNRQWRISELVAECVEQKIEIEGEVLELSNENLIADVNDMVADILKQCTAWKLIDANWKRPPPTQRLRLIKSTEPYVKLSELGKKIYNFSDQHKQFYFLRKEILEKIKLITIKYKFVITIFAIIFTILRMLLQVNGVRSALLALMGAFIVWLVSL